jgi:hypothetical protein
MVHGRLVNAQGFLHSALGVRVRDPMDHLVAFSIVLKMPELLGTPFVHPP